MRILLFVPLLCWARYRFSKLRRATNDAIILGSLVVQPHIRGGVVSTTSNGMDGAPWLRHTQLARFIPCASSVRAVEKSDSPVVCSGTLWPVGEKGSSDAKARLGFVASSWSFGFSPPSSNRCRAAAYSYCLRESSTMQYHGKKSVSGRPHNFPY